MLQSIEQSIHERMTSLQQLPIANKIAVLGTDIRETLSNAIAMRHTWSSLRLMSPMACTNSPVQLLNFLTV